MLIGYARVSKADGSQSLDLQRDALQAASVDAVHVYHDFASGVRDDRRRYGTARHGDGPSAVTGGRGAHTGRPDARRPRGSGRAPAVTPPPSYPRRRLIMTGPGRSRARPTRP